MFTTGFRYPITRADSDCDWIAALACAAGSMWVAVRRAGPMVDLSARGGRRRLLTNGSNKN